MSRIQEALKDAPKTYLERVQAANQARALAREFLIQELLDELSVFQNG
ncbi:MAG: hypothetical protein ACREXX_18455 [Gammaproteobacteria bacterium]